MKQGGVHSRTRKIKTRRRQKWKKTDSWNNNGDPSGNGPEISVKALMNPVAYENCKPVIVGDAVSMEAAIAAVSGAENMKLNVIKDVKDAKFEYGTIDVYDMGIIDINKRLYKKDRKKMAETMSPEALEAAYKESRKMCGECAFRYVEKVIGLAMAGEVDATVTNALNKDHINMAGHHYSGHTEIYAHYTNTPKYTMMLAHEGLRVVHVSTHVSLREACNRVKRDRVLDCIRIANEGCRALGIKRAEDRCGRTESTLWRKRNVWPGRNRGNPAGNRCCNGRRHSDSGESTDTAGYGIFQSAWRMV